MKQNIFRSDKGMIGLIEIGLVTGVLVVAGLAIYAVLHYSQSAKSSQAAATTTSKTAATPSAIANTAATAVDQTVSTVIADPSASAGDIAIPDDSTAAAQNLGGIDESQF